MRAGFGMMAMRTAGRCATLIAPGRANWAQRRGNIRPPCYRSSAPAGVVPPRAHLPVEGVMVREVPLRMARQS